MSHPSREEGKSAAAATTTTTEEEEEEEKENNKELFKNSSPLPSLRTPLNTIPDPSQNPKQTHHSSSFKVQPRGSHKTRNTTPPGNFRPQPQPVTQIPHFELVQDPSFWTHHNVQVLIRIRPISSTERALHANLRCLNQDNAQTLSSLAHPHTTFTFDHVASETISQEDLFRVAGLPMVENCMSGYNSCMFAYGQTGSGKTYTMMGDIYDMGGNMNKDCGMTPRIFEYLFTRISHEEERHCNENLRYSCKCSFLEIYNEQITDLLEPSSTNLQLREDMGKGVYVENLTEYQVTTVNDVVKLLLKGAANRKIAATNMNAESSRSHSVFTCVIESRRDIDSVTHLRFGRLNLVDLAGSERQKSSGAEGERLKESANINKSLSTLGLVIMTLVDVTHGKHRHVPYRDSRLTFLLQDSLGGNSKTTIIANISPSVCSASETLSTLKFAQRAKLIQNNAKVNEDVSGDVMALQRQIQQLKEQLNCLHTHQNSSKSLPNCWPNIEQPQSGDVDTTCSSTLEGRIYDHHKNRSFSKWKMGCINATLVGALRREKMAEASARRLEAEIEHMNHLVHQLEEDAQRTKMILKFREEKIIKLELMSDGVISSGEYLMEENKALSEEIQLLQARTDRNPKLTRFALENIRLIEQLRMFQDFYEQDERETLLAEISEMRAQLMETAQENCVHLQYPQGTANQEQEQEKDLTFELENCRRNREACLKTNAKLTMKVDQLQRKLNTYTDCSRADLTVDSGSTDSGPIQHSESHSSVEIISFRNASKGKMSYCSNKDRIFQIRDEQNMDNVLDSQCKDPPKELMDANSLIETMEHEQLQLIGELEILQKMNTQDAGLLETKDSEHSKFLFKLENNIYLLQRTISPGSGDEGIWMEGSDDTRRFTFIIKLEGLNRDLGEARILNKIYLDDLASQIFHKNELHQVRQQVEVETSKTILNLREELSKLQEEFQQKMISMTEENSRLKSTIEARENKLNMLSEEWEIALLELTSFLIDGSRSLKEASEQIGSIASSFPEKKAWISEQVGRAAGNFLKKESTIVKLQKSLETAQKLGLEMKSKLSSLQGAVLAITEVQQLEQNEYSREVIQLRTLLTEKVVKIEDLEEKLNVDQIIEADKLANDSQTRCLETHNHLGVCNQEAFGQVCVQAASPQLQHLERSSKEAEAGFTNTVEVLHFKLDDVGEEKITMPSSFFIKFEEAQATVKEADDMLNELVKANENAKHVSDRWKQAGAELMIERENLIEEVQQLKFSIGLKEAQYETLQCEMCSSLEEVALSISSLEESFLQMQRDVEFNLKVVYSDIFSLGQDLCSFTCRSRSSLEDIWAAIMENGLALFVLYQCYVGNLFNNISSLKLDPDYYRHKQRNCYSVIDNVGEGCTRATGGSTSSKDTDKVEGYEIENLKHKLCSPRHTLELKPSFDLDYINIIAANLALQRELDRKDALLKGLLFDISLLQESTFSSNDMKDKTEQMFAALTMVRHELGVKTTQLDEILLQHRKLETQVVDCEAALCISNSKLKQADETIEVLSKNNSELMVMLNNLDVEKTAVKENLEEQKEAVKGLEKEILRLASSVEKISLFSVEDNINELINVIAERDRLREEVLSLNNRLEVVTALADENEAIAVEARQESKASKVYAEQKEEEANILEHSVEELECTINALEKKVDDMAAEVERYYTMRDDEEAELQALRMRMLCFENSTEYMDSECPDFGLKEYQTARVLIERTLDLEELKKQMRVLKREREDQAIEIKKCREHISELVLHGEAQASQYQHKYKTLEAMVREVITDTQASNPLTSTLDKAEKSSTRTRGSSSPFRCIASLVQQMKVEKDQEMEAALLKMEELEALASSRQKEVCMLNARLAAAENMTHDVIRDLLGVKLDMTNYATLIDKHQVHKSLEEAQQHIDESIAKEQEILKLSKKINDLTDERQSCIEEINQREADNLAAQVALEQLKQRDQLLTAQNEMLKMDKINLKKKMEKMEEMLKKHFGPHNMQQEIPQPKVLKENNFLRSSSEKLRERLTNSDKLLSFVNDELAWHPKSDDRDPHDKQ